MPFPDDAVNPFNRPRPLQQSDVPAKCEAAKKCIGAIYQKPFGIKRA